MSFSNKIYSEGGFVTSARQKPLTVGALFVCLAILGGISIWHVKGQPSRKLSDSRLSSPKQFFSADDGKTWFADDALKVPPFETPSGLAYRARVFRCPDGQPFVGYLERYPDDLKKQLDNADGVQRQQLIARLEYGGKFEVKRPNDAEWVPRQSMPPIHAAGCPAESLIPVFPSN